MIRKVFKTLTWLNAAEATVISFVITSLIGGGALWLTENNRQTSYKFPVLENVTMTRQNSDETLTPAIHQTEKLTYIKEEKVKGISFVDAWFTSVSALCVTGLTTSDFSQFTLPGQIITMLLIQMGGLGIIVFTSLLALAVVRGLSEKMSMRTFLSGILDTSHDDVSRMLKHVTMYTLLFEGTAFLVMGVHLQWFSDPALLKGINPWWWALFHSVSAFNNAGFGLMNDNLMSFAKDPIINLAIAGLIILGGMGYPVLISIHAAFRRKFTNRKNRDKKQLELEEDVKGVVASDLQTKLAIWATIGLLALGTFIPFFLDYNSPIYNDYSIPEKIMANFFQSVSTRTAGFNTVDIGSLTYGTLMLFCALMFIGANPAGTAGGIKIPTLGVLYAYMKDWFKAPGQPVQLFRRTISKFALSHAVRLFFFSTLFVFVIIFLICALENNFMFTPDNAFNFMYVEAESFFHKIKEPLMRL